MLNVRKCKIYHQFQNYNIKFWIYASAVSYAKIMETLIKEFPSPDLKLGSSKSTLRIRAICRRI